MAYTFFKLNIIPLARLKMKKVGGLENIPSNHNFILASNHNSWLDPLYYVAALCKVIKKKIYFISGSKKYSGLGIIAINKKNKAKTVEKAIKYLKKGKIIFNFIEGRSNPTNTLLEPKTGTARMALQSRLPVIPLSITGLKGSSPVTALLWFLFSLRRVKIKIGKPLSFEKFYGREETRDLLNEISYKILKEISKLCGKRPPQDIYL